MESRQVRRVIARRAKKMEANSYPRKAQKGGPSRSLIHKNRRHRDDGLDYFK